MNLFRWITQFHARWSRSKRFEEAKRWHERLEAQPVALQLEPRRVFNAAPIVAPPAPPAEVIVNAGQFANDGQADTFVVSRSAAGTAVTVNGQFQQMIDPSQRLVIEGSHDSDHLRIDVAQSDTAAASVEFAGNGGSDFLQIEGTTQSVTHVFAADGSAQIQIDGGSLSYTGDVSVTDSLQATTRAFELEGAQAVQFSDASAAGFDQVQGQFGQHVLFSSSASTLQIDGQNGALAADRISIDGLDQSFHGDLLIRGDALDSVNISGQISLGSGDLHVTAGEITVGGQIATSAADVRLEATLKLTVEAGSRIVDMGGTIVADAGATGTLIVSGELDTSNLLAGQTGGAIHLLGNQIQLRGATVSARGDAGGGSILVGGDYQGNNAAIRNASRTSVDRESRLNASAVTQGHGGRVIVWANEATWYAGTITATGGIRSGNGGFAEVSGRSLSFQGWVDLASAHGAAGTLLLDPKNITVTNGGADVVVDNDEFAENPATDATFDADLLTAILNTGTNLTLQANNDLSINEEILVNNVGGDGGNLTLQAGRSILISSNITTDHGGLTVIANDPGALAANRDAGAAVITMDAGTAITAGTGTVNLTVSQAGVGPVGDITLADLTSAALIVSNIDGQIVDTNSTTITVNNNSSFAGATITLGGAGTATNFGSLTFQSDGAVTIQEDSATELAGTNTADSLIVESNGVITDTSTSLAVTNNANLSGTAISLGGAGINTNLGSVTFNSAGAVTIQEDSATQLAGANTANSLILESAGAITDSATSLAVTNNANFTGTAITLGGAGITTNLGSLTFNSTGAVTIQEDSATQLAGANSAYSLSLNSAAAITDASTSLAVTNNASLNGTTITLGGAGIATNLGSVTFNSAGAVTIQEDSATQLTGANSVNSLILNSAGAITDASTSLAVTNNATLTGTAITLGGLGITTNLGSLTFNSAGAVTIQVDSGMTISAASSAGGLTLSNTDDINLNAVVNVVGATAITAEGSIDVNNKLTGTTTILLIAGEDITVDANIDPTTVTMQADDDITINAAVIANDLITLSAGQDGTGSVVISGTGSLTADNAGNTSEIAITSGATAGSITLAGTTTADATIAMTSAAGSITGSGLITASAVALDAGTNIGSVGTRIQTNANNLEARAGNGGIFVTEFNGVTIGGASGGLTGLTTTGGNGSIDLNTTAGSITISEAVTANGSGNVTLAAAGLLSVNQAVSSTTGNLALTGGTGVSHTAAGDLLTGGVGTIGVTATTGGITMADGTTYSTGSGAITLLANSSVALGRLSTSGPVNVTATNGSITDSTAGEGAGNENIAGGTVTLTAATGVGATGAAGEIDTAATTLIASSATGGIFLAETDSVAIGPLATTTSGDIVLVAGGAVTTSGNLTTAGNGNLSVSTTAGGITLSHNVIANGTGNVSLDAAGNIVQTAGTVNGEIVRLISTASIGTAGQRIQLDAKHVAARANGDIYLTVNDSNQDGVIIGAEDGAADGLAGLTTSAATGIIDFVELTTLPGGGITISEAVSAAGGGITIRADSPLIVNADVTDNGGGNILLAAEGTTAADDLTINANITASGGNGMIELFAGDSITQTAARIVSAAGVGTITARAGTDYNAGVIQDGTNTGGIVMAATAEIQSQDGNITLRAPGNIAVAILNANSNANGTAGNVFITADDPGVSGTQGDNVGAITDANAATLNVTANGLAMLAATGIGTSSDRIETQVTTVAAANDTSGGIFIEEVAAGGDLIIGTVGIISGLNANPANGDISVVVNAGNLAVNDTVQAGNGTVRLRVSGNVTQTAAITADSLGAVSTAGFVDLSLATNDVATFAAQATTANQFVNLQDATAIEVGQVTAGNVFGATLAGIQANTTNGTVRLQAADNITQTAAGVITANALGVRSTAGSIDLSQPNNDVTVLSAEALAANQSVNYQDATGVQIDQVTAGGQIAAFAGIQANTATGTVRLQAGNDITQTAIGVITADALGARSVAGTIDLSQPNNNVNTIAAQALAANQAVNFQDSTGFTVGSVSAGGLLAARNGIQANATTGIVRLQALTGDIEQTTLGTITANEFGAVAKTGDVCLALSPNQVNEFAAKAAGEVAFNTVSPFMIGTVTAGGGPAAPYRLFDTVPGVDLVGVQANDVFLQATGDITQDTAILADSLAARSTTGSVDLSLATNDVNIFAAEATAANQAVNFQDLDGFEVGSVTSTCFATTLDGIATDQATGVVRLQAVTDDITQTAAGVITGDRLGVNAKAGNVVLCAEDNDVQTFAAKASGGVSFRDVDVFQIGTVTKGGGPDPVNNARLFEATPGIDLQNIVAPTEINLIAGGNLNVNQALTSDTVRLVSETGSVTQTAIIDANRLAAQANNFVSLTGNNVVDNFASRAGNYVDFNSTVALTIDTVAASAIGCVGATDGIIANAAGASTNARVEVRVANGDLSINRPITINNNASNVNENVRLRTENGDVRQTATGVITADGLSVQALSAAQVIDLNQVENNVRNFAAIAEGNIDFLNRGTLTITDIAAGTLVNQAVNGVTATNGGNINVETTGAANGILTVLSPVNTTANLALPNTTITLTGGDSVAIGATIGNSNTNLVTILARDADITRVLAVPTANTLVTAKTVNLQARNNVGPANSAANINQTELELQQGVDNWNNVLNGNPAGIYVKTSTLNVTGATTPNVANNVFVDVNPLTANSTVEIAPIVAGGDVVITSGPANNMGTLNINGVQAGKHILIQTDAANVNLDGDLQSALLRVGTTNTNAIAVDAGGTLTKDAAARIVTGNMVLLQLIQDQVHGRFNASVNNELQNGIYRDYNSFYVRPPFPSPNEAIIRPLEENSIIATYGINGERGWNITIDWGDGTAISNYPTDSEVPPNRPNGSLDQDANPNTPLSIPHLYEFTASATYDVDLTVSVDDSISLAGTVAGEKVRYETQTLQTRVEVSAVPVPPSLFLRPENPPATRVELAAVQSVNSVQPLQNPPEEALLVGDDLPIPEQVKYLKLVLVPEDGTEERVPEGVPEKLGLETLNGSNLLDLLKKLDDGRYRLQLIRAIRTGGVDDVFDERTVLETVIKNGVPTNPIDDVIERLRRQMNREIDARPEATPAESDAQLELQPFETPVMRQTPEITARDDSGQEHAAAIGGVGFFTRLLSYWRGRTQPESNSTSNERTERRAG